MPRPILSFNEDNLPREVRLLSSNNSPRKASPEPRVVTATIDEEAEGIFNSDNEG
jgi:hypothetical protein